MKKEFFWDVVLAGQFKPVSMVTFSGFSSKVQIKYKI
jgi:hypothetical protein